MVFSLNKEFTDAILLWYGWSVEDLPSKFSSGSSFNVRHAMKVKKADFALKMKYEL